MSLMIQAHLLDRYGPAFPAILKAEQERRRRNEAAREIAPMLIDDVASQAHPEPWVVSWALGQYFGPVHGLSRPRL